MKVLITKKTVYGNDMFYPANEQAELFASIAGQKTLSYATLKAAEKLGFTVELTAEKWS
tara:strand:- start:260 stop:436 length:177 start_codon:yes stop_codon:yes gene_type:complete